MSAKEERLRFLRASKDSLNRDIESLEKRGGSDSLSDYKEQLKKLEAEIARVEAQPEMNADVLSPELLRKNKRAHKLESDIKNDRAWLKRLKSSATSSKNKEVSDQLIKECEARIAKMEKERIGLVKLVNAAVMADKDYD